MIRPANTGAHAIVASSLLLTACGDSTPTPAAHQNDTASSPASAPPSSTPEGTVWIPGGTFTMGSTDPLARPDESPVHTVRVDPFFIGRTEVTNAQFQAFVDDTGYVTLAERPVDWESLKEQVPPGTPKPPDELLQPGSLVFSPPDHPVDLDRFDQWWQWTTGADWRHPEGPGSTIDDRAEHPVVHIAHEDAIAYANWKGGRLPTEAEWEFAARGGLDHTVNIWGDQPIDPTRCNTWQGRFPHETTNADGFARTAPVGTFPPNGYGLHDAAGNVWEWCADLYRPDSYAARLIGIPAGTALVNPTGPATSHDPRNPLAPKSFVQRGGSFLCHDDYCASYRPSARMACTPDTSLAHTGFRIVIDP